MIQPNIKTERLFLRAFHSKDSAAMVKICNDPDIAKNTSHIPFPYTMADARLFLKRMEEGGSMGKIVAFAITNFETKEVIGAIGLTFEKQHDRAEVGYYLGADFRGMGYATEALSAVIKYGFEFCKLNRIVAHVFTFNPVSVKVLEKAGMSKEGILKSHFKKNGFYEDQIVYGIIHPERKKI